MYYYGDELYASEYNLTNIRDLIDRQALHCNRVTLINPINNKEMSFNAKIPDDIAHLI